MTNNTNCRETGLKGFYFHLGHQRKALSYQCCFIRFIMSRFSILSRDMVETCRPQATHASQMFIELITKYCRNVLNTKINIAGFTPLAACKTRFLYNTINTFLK